MHIDWLPAQHFNAASKVEYVSMYSLTDSIENVGFLWEKKKMRAVRIGEFRFPFNYCPEMQSLEVISYVWPAKRARESICKSYEP